MPEFVKQVSGFVDRTDAMLAQHSTRLARLEDLEADWRVRVEQIERNIQQLIEALRREHPNGQRGSE